MTKVAMSLQELLAALIGENAEMAVEHDAVGVMSERERQLQASVKAYTKKVVADSMRITETLLDMCSCNSCEHPDHRLVPLTSFDMKANNNLMAWLVDMHIDLSKRIARVSWSNGSATAEGLPFYDTSEVDATFTVVGAAMMTLSELMVNGPDDQNELRKEFATRVRKRVADNGEALLTGRVVAEPKASVCH